MKIYWFKKKEIILIFMFSIDLMLAGEPIRATRACESPSYPNAKVLREKQVITDYYG